VPGNTEKWRLSWNQIGIKQFVRDEAKNEGERKRYRFHQMASFVNFYRRTSNGESVGKLN
jgi:hypothetical protein